MRSRSTGSASSAAGWLAAVLVLSACGRQGLSFPAGPTPTPTATPTPTPNPDGPLEFQVVASPLSTIRPGLRAVRVTATLFNSDPVQMLTGFTLSLSFQDSLALNRSADFIARELVWAGSLPASATTDVSFDVDIAASANAASAITVGGRADYRAGATLHTDFAVTPATWTFEPLGEIVVQKTDDQIDGGDGMLNLREAILLANSQAGTDRIRFDPAVFPPGTPVTILLDDELPLVDAGNRVVLDGTGSAVIVEPDGTLASSGKWVMRFNEDAVVHGLTFKQTGSLYPVTNIATDNCGGGDQTGGAIRVQGGSVVISGNVFDDGGVPERNCFAQLIDLGGGSQHHVVDNQFLALSGDAVYTTVDTYEISRNRISVGTDDGFILEAGTGPTRLVGNLFVDLEHSGLLVLGGGANGRLLVANDTFVRCSSAGVRSAGPRPMDLWNSVFLANMPSGLDLDQGGQNVTLSHLSSDQNPLCTGGVCANATVPQPASLGFGPFVFANPLGTAWADFLPLATSPLLSSGSDQVDVNGSRLGRFDGLGPERGAVEAPP